MTNEEFSAKLAEMPMPTIATGLLNLEVMLEHIKKNTGKPLELDSLKLSDEERRQQFGARVRIMRKALGLTQTELAEKLGVTNQAIATYEKGKREPNFRNLLGLSRALNVTIDWLLGNDLLPIK